MHQHPRLVAFDLDGTLAESKQRVSSNMGELLSALLQKMPIAVMSGIGWSQFQKQFFPALPLDANLNNLYLFPDNAAQCFVYRSGEWKPQYDYMFSTTHKGITKAYGIERLAELAGIPISQMLYVGDALDEGGNDSVVKETGVQTHQVFGPEETTGLISALLK